MTRILGMLVVGLFLAVGTAQAHCGKCGIGEASKSDMKAMGDAKLDMMKKELVLTDEQAAQVKQIMTAKMEKKQKLMDEKHKAMEALHDDFKAQLKGVLNEAQFKKWEEVKDRCPMCKDGKMCEMCMKKGKGDKMDGHHGHKH